MIPSRSVVFQWVKEWKIAIILFTNAIIFLAFFYSDITQRSDIGSREIIGDLSFKYNKTQRKFDKELVWDSLDANAPLSNRDTVRTDTGSQAILRLKDGTEIQMDEDSMVLLEITPKLQRIKFEKGSINIKKNPVPGTEFSSIYVESPTGTVQVNDGDIIVAKSIGDSFDVGVERGEAKVRIGSNSVSLKANQVLVEKEGTLVAKDSRVRLKDPITRAKEWERTKISSIQEEQSPAYKPSSQKQTTSPNIPITKKESKPIIETKAAPIKKDSPLKVSNPTLKKETKPIENSLPQTTAKEQISPAKQENSPPANKATTESKATQPTKVEAPASVDNVPEVKKKPEPAPVDPTEELRRKREQAELERFLKM